MFLLVFSKNFDFYDFSLLYYNKKQNQLAVNFPDSSSV